MYKTYSIENKEFNAIDLGKEMGITQQTARNRLKIAKTIDDLYRPLHNTIYKIHIIEDEEFTSQKVAKLLNCSDSTARARLVRSKTIEELLQPLVVRQSLYNNVNEGRVIDIDMDDTESRMRKLVMGAW
jgi:response regulator of citrate/malate metabolism